MAPHPSTFRTLGEHGRSSIHTPRPPFGASTLDGWVAGILPDLNQDDPELARYLIQNTLWSIARTGIVGIRQDTVPYVPRRFWRDWTAAIRARYFVFKAVGEVFESARALSSFFPGGRARFEGIDTDLDSVFDFPLQDAIARVFTARPQPANFQRCQPTIICTRIPRA